MRSIYLINILLLTIVIESNCLNKQLCRMNLTEIITDGQKIGDIIIKDDIIYTKDVYFYHKNNILGCKCNVKNCIRKCCPDGHSFTNNTCAFDKNAKLIEIDVHDSVKFLHTKNITDYYVLNGYSCASKGRLNLSPDEYEEDRYYFQENGHIHVPGMNAERYMEADEYCIENQYFDHNSSEVVVFLCVIDEIKDEESHYSAEYFPGKIVSNCNKFNQKKGLVFFF